MKHSNIEMNTEINKLTYEWISKANGQRLVNYKKLDNLMRNTDWSSIPDREDPDLQISLK